MLVGLNKEDMLNMLNKCIKNEYDRNFEMILKTHVNNNALKELLIELIEKVYENNK
jgi:hypothetical protein